MSLVQDPRLTRSKIVFAAALIAALAPLARAQDPKPAQPPAVLPIEQRIEAFMTQLEARRKELNVVGASIVIAQGDRIVRIAGLGLRQESPPLPVTEDTVFMIASATKQFTAMAVALAVGEGKMALEDHPRRFVPDFRLKDAEADAKLTILDLLTHRTGIDRADASFQYLPFTQAELFALAQRATPVAKLRERTIYNNTMYSLAGAALARAYGTSYERFMRDRMLTPLGMNSTTLTHAEFLAASDRATGYTAGAPGERAAMKAVNPDAIAPAGAINSTARDMGAWLRFLNAGGQTAGLTVAPAAYARVFEAYQPVGDGTQYGLGFQVRTRAGVLFAHHGGNLPGFSAEVVHVPARALSMALLTNQNASVFAGAARELFWEIVVKPELPAAATPTDKTPAPPTTAARPIAPDQLIGTYFASEDLTIEVKKGDTGLVLIPPGAPPLPMKEAGVNQYDLDPAGAFGVRFAESETMRGRIEAAILRPPSQGKPIPLLKKDEAWLVRARAQHAGPNAELIGFYHSADRKMLLEIVPFRDGLAVNLVGSPLQVLIGAGGDAFRFEGQPETHRLLVKRTAGGQVIGFTLELPTARQEMIAEGSAAAKDPARAREILERAVAAAGGAEALDRIVSYTAIGTASAATQGFEGPAQDRIVPGKRAALVELGAFGKFMKIQSLTNDRTGWAVWIDGARIPIDGKSLAVARFFAVPHPLYRWKERFAAVGVLGETMVKGENAYVIELTPPGLAPSKLYISTQSHLVLREETPVYDGDEAELSTSVDISDHRAVDGVRLPFTFSLTLPLLGEVVVAYESISISAPIDPKEFEAQ